MRMNWNSRLFISLKNVAEANSFPVKWNGPDLKADGNTVAIESVELVHQGLVWVV